MAIIVDTNTLGLVFNEKCRRHSEFKPVHDWIIHGRGRVVYGGSKYKKELQNAGLVPLFLQLKNSRRAVEIKEGLVDGREAELIDLTQDTDCDDQHVIAILCVSRCLLVCSEDSRSYKFLKLRKFYPKGYKGPKIYRSLNNIGLLCLKNCVKLRNTL